MIKLCPFCRFDGAAATTDAYTHWVQCKCGARGPSSATEIGAITLWNVRCEVSMKISDNGISFLKRWEGVRKRVYLDSVRKPTVGVGHLVLPQDKLKVGDVISDAQVDAFLRQDVAIAEKAVNDLKLSLTQNQFDALVSFTFNLGGGGLKNLLRLGFDAVPKRILLFDKAGRPLRRIQGLTNRRQAERKLFLSPV